MPYIQRDRRPPIDKGIAAALEHIDNPGDLNYAITTLCLGWLRKSRISYHRFNTVMGVLSCAAHELYRDRIARYEDCAKVANGPLGA